MFYLKDRLEIDRKTKNGWFNPPENLDDVLPFTLILR